MDDRAGPQTPIERFLTLLVGNADPGLFICVASAIREGSRLFRFRDEFFTTSDIAAATEWVLEQAREGREVFACPALFRFAERKAVNVESAWAIWADHDAPLIPILDFPDPSLEVETSMGKSHRYYALEEAIGPDELELLNKRLAEMTNGDPATWDRARLMRIPGTENYKSSPSFTARLVRSGGERHDVAYLRPLLGFDERPGAESTGDRQQKSDDRHFDFHGEDLNIWNGEAPAFKPDGQVDRSASLYKIAQMLKRAGVTKADGARMLAERDFALGWWKYTSRPEQYERLCEDVWGAQAEANEPPNSERMFRSVIDYEVRPMDWLVQGVLPAGGLGMIVGHPGRGKSFVAFGLAASISAGGTWMGHEVKHGSALYVVAEGATELPRRRAAWQALNPNRSLENLMIYDKPIQLYDTAEVDSLIGHIKLECQKPVNVVIFDTVARCTSGVDENSAQHMGKVIENCDKIRRATGAAVLLIHHPNKREGQVQMRGSSALEGALDTMITATKHGAIITLRCAKQKDAAPFPDMRLEAVPIVGSVALRLAAQQPSGQTALTPPEQVLMDSLAANQPLGFGGWQKLSGLAKTTFDRARKGLLDKELVTLDETTRMYQVNAQNSTQAEDDFD